MGIYHGTQAGKHNYIPSAITRWLTPKDASGNDYNGVGVTERVPPRPQMFGPIPNPLTKMLFWFFFRVHMTSWQGFVPSFQHKWRDMRGHKDIAPQKVKKSPEEFTKDLEDFVNAHPEVDVFGVRPMIDAYKYEGQDNLPYKYIIVLGKGMDYDDISKNLDGDFVPAVRQVMGGYNDTHMGAVDLANWIRSQGWPAKGYGGMSVIDGEWHLMIPPAIDAGLGQLAKNGSVINDELGSCFRLATVLTDMPLMINEAREIGVEEFCVSCRKCVTDCPPGAISDDKQMVRGIEKWYVNIDKCMPYMLEHLSCGICLTTCPWSRPGIAPSLSQKMLKKLGRKQDSVTA